MRKLMATLTIVSGMAAASSAAGEPHMISDQGLLRVFAVKAVCRDRRSCLDLEYMPAAQRTLTLDQVIERDGPPTKVVDPPELWLIIPMTGRTYKEPPSDEGPAAF